MGVLIPAHREGSCDLLLNFGTPGISGMGEIRDLKFCVHIARGQGVVSFDQLFTYATPYISQERLKLESPAHAACVAHLMQPLPNYFDILLKICILTCS